MKDAIDIVGRQLQSANMHLARKKMGLRVLLAEDEPRIRLRSGDHILLDKRELEDIAGIIPSGTDIRLPIYIELSSDKYGPGTARIEGKQECLVVGHILGKGPLRDETTDQMFIYRPQVAQLRRRLPTTTQYMFTLASDL